MKSWTAIALILVASAALAGKQAFQAVPLDQWRSIHEPLIQAGRSTEPRLDPFNVAMVEQLPAQQRAERALELSVNRYSGAAEYVITHAQSWRGLIEPGPRLDTLITAAINSPLLEIRMAGFEIHLAQYGLEKSPQQVDNLLHRLHADPVDTGPWALWSMAVIGARGVDRERILDELMLATTHPEIQVRRWAVDALARLGGVEVIEPLLHIAMEDASPVVRERAFCGLAQSGTLHVAERYAAIPGLIAIAENPQSQPQTLEWTYQALREISHVYDVPNDPDAWRDLLSEVAL